MEWEIALVDKSTRDLSNTAAVVFDAVESEAGQTPRLTKEFLRNTVELIGRSGTGHGNVHWTANFDEIQDFENEIRAAFSGSGFLSQADWLASQDPLGAPKAGRSADLDALAAYLASLTRFPRSPYRNPDGSLTADAVAGKLLFGSAGCATCHAGATFRDGARAWDKRGDDKRAVANTRTIVGLEVPRLVLR